MTNGAGRAVERVEKPRPGKAKRRVASHVALPLFVSFWSVCLENLPQGDLRHRALSPREAKWLIDAARAADILSGASEDDLWAPDHEREKDNHAKLCRALRKHYGIELSMRDFLLRDLEAAGQRRPRINSLQLVEVGTASRLLVVDCHFALRDRRRQGRPDFDVAPDSAKFHLFEAIASSDSPRTRR